MKFFTGSNAPTVKPVPWLVPGFLAQGAGTILFGQPGVGKTTHGAALTASLVMGEDFGPFQVLKSCRVLYWIVTRLLFAKSDCITLTR
jgi:RecA-family ATPase